MFDLITSVLLTKMRGLAAVAGRRISKSADNLPIFGLLSEQCRDNKVYTLKVSMLCITTHRRMLL